MFRTCVRGDLMLKNKYKIVNRRRFNIFIISVALIIALITVLFINNNKAYSSTYNNLYKEVVVNKGDTLWNIALRNIPDNYDIRKMVYEIREFNNMDNANIYPGDTIKIPIKHSK